MMTKEGAGERLAEAMASAIKRLETIQETHSEIALDNDLALYRDALDWYRRIPSMSEREHAFSDTRLNQGHDALVEAWGKRAGTVEVTSGSELPHLKIVFDDKDAMRAFNNCLMSLPTPQAEAAPDDGLVAELRAELEAIQGPKKGEDEHPEWLSTLLNVCRDIEDEGDRVYFGSTNDADDLRDVVEALEQAHHPLHLFRRPDLHRHNSELRKLNEAQAARIAELADENTSLRARPSGDGGWQPIETAPKNEDMIFLYAPSCGVYEGYQYNVDGDEWTFLSGSGEELDQPTHWQPLPEPPALSTIKGEE